MIPPSFVPMAIPHAPTHEAAAQTIRNLLEEMVPWVPCCFVSTCQEFRRFLSSRVILHRSPRSRHDPKATALGSDKEIQRGGLRATGNQGNKPLKSGGLPQPASVGIAMLPQWFNGSLQPKMESTWKKTWFSFLSLIYRKSKTSWYQHSCDCDWKGPTGRSDPFSPLDPDLSLSSSLRVAATAVGRPFARRRWF